MSSYSSVLAGSYSLSKENMRIHLEHEHEEKMNIIDNIHSEAMERLSNERNRDNNYHSQQMQRLSIENNRNNNEHIERMQRIRNEGEDNR